MTESQGAPISNLHRHTDIHTQDRIADPEHRHMYRHEGINTQMTRKRTWTQAWIQDIDMGEDRYRCKPTQETNVQTCGETHMPTDTCSYGCTHPHMRRDLEGVRRTFRQRVLSKSVLVPGP